MTFRLIVSTQVHENYGDAEKPHWKAKGGTDYEVTTLTLEEVCRMSQDELQTLAFAAAAKVEHNDEWYQEYVIAWDLIDGLTHYEQQQLDYDGRITSPARKLEA